MRSIPISPGCRRHRLLLHGRHLVSRVVVETGGHTHPDWQHELQDGHGKAVFIAIPALVTLCLGEGTRGCRNVEKCTYRQAYAATLWPGRQANFVCQGALLLRHGFMGAQTQKKAAGRITFSPTDVPSALPGIFILHRIEKDLPTRHVSDTLGIAGTRCVRLASHRVLTAALLRGNEPYGPEAADCPSPDEAMR